jgi:hypothetical protein
VQNTFQKCPGNGFEFLQVAEEMATRCNYEEFEFLVMFEKNLA